MTGSNPELRSFLEAEMFYGVKKRERIAYLVAGGGLAIGLMGMLLGGGVVMALQLAGSPDFAGADYALFKTAFGALVTGVLQPVATSLGVSVAAVGQTMTAYAIATAVLAPMVLVATASWPRKATLQVALFLFGCGMLVCGLSENLTSLLAGRVLMGAGAVFTPISASIAVAVVTPERQGKALSLTFLGMSLSYVVGLPIGAWLGLRFGWRVPVLWRPCWSFSPCHNRKRHSWPPSPATPCLMRPAMMAPN